MTYKAVIWGCGSIGALKGNYFDSPTTDAVLTHAHAIYNNPNTELSGVVDEIDWKAKKAAEKWKTQIYDGMSEIDIAVIAVPTKQHVEVVTHVARHYMPKLILVEKPVGSSLKECSEIVKITSRYAIPVVVNYIRRFEPRHKLIAKAMSEEKQVYGCRVMYGRGLMHDGCHALDLMNWWFGDIISCIRTNEIIDSQHGTSYGFAANYQRCPQVIFTPVDSKEVGLFEIDIISAAGLQSLSSNGSRYRTRSVKQGDAWGDYPSLSNVLTKTFKTQLTSAMELLYNNIVSHLQYYKPLHCTDVDAAKVWRAYDKIKN